MNEQKSGIYGEKDKLCSGSDFVLFFVFVFQLIEVCFLFSHVYVFHRGWQLGSSVEVLTLEDLS